MSALLRLLYLNGATTVVAVPVDGTNYADAFAALEAEESVRIVICDSGEAAVHTALKSSVERASARPKGARRRGGHGGSRP